MRENGAILALDIATRTGWAYGKPGELPLSGSERLAPAGSSNGAVGRGLLRWLTDFTKVNAVAALYIEAPMNPQIMGGKTTFGTARMLIGLCFLAETVAEARGIYFIREANVQDVRKHFLGKARPKDKKREVMARCKALGWDHTDDNEADALALWAYACAVEAPRTGHATAPLFGGA